MNTKKRKAVLCIGSYIILKRKVKCKTRSCWTKNWLRKKKSLSHLPLLQELRDEPGDFKNYLRMDETVLNDLLNMVNDRLTKQNTQMRECISPYERLVATLRFLATGRSYEDLKYSTGISAQSLGRIIPETCKILYEELKDEYMKVRKYISYEIKYLLY